MTAATVLIPTFDHGPMLRYALLSALNQTIQDIEILVVGDGSGGETRKAVESVEDYRVRLYEYPKGERHGEAWRHQALQLARGRFVCYLSDDDLWFPDHLQRMSGILEGADFAHTIPLVVAPMGGMNDFDAVLCDLGRERYRRKILTETNLIPLSCAGHTMKAYKAMEGWSPAPEGVFTDLAMWRKFLEKGWCKPASDFCPTVLHFPSHRRKDMGINIRCAELEHWWGMATELGFMERGWEMIRRTAFMRIARLYAGALQG